MSQRELDPWEVGKPKPMDADVDIIARTIAGEARGCGYLDMLAVGAVLRERLLRPGWWSSPNHDWFSVCTKPWQFSCWNENDPNRKTILHAEVHIPEVWPLCMQAAELTVHNMRDRDLHELFGTKGPFPTHYHARGIAWPKWSRGAKIVHVPWDSAHIFFLDVEGTPKRTLA